MANHDIERARNLLEVFKTLNPVSVEMVERELLSLAPNLPKSFREELFSLVEEVIDTLLASPVKRSEQAIMSEYFSFLAKGSQRMIEAGELRPEPRSGGSSLALVPNDLYDAGDWCRLTSRVELPAPMLNAVDAAKRRNYLVEAVLEPLFRTMLQVDREAGFAWQLELASGRQRKLDPDVARDLLRTWQREANLPKDAYRQALTWSEDQNVGRHWPAVVEEADRLLRQHALRAWLADDPPVTGPNRLLPAMAPFVDEKRQLRWLKTAVGAMGTSVDFFAAQSERSAATASDWRTDALCLELKRLHDLLPPLLLMADLLLSAPLGGRDFAMAVFGFTPEFKRSWDRALIENSKQAIRRLFMNDLRLGRSPEATIHRLCFGNEELEGRVREQLDFFTRQFDSYMQREKAVDQLSGMYGSSREASLLATELGRRYRRMMRVLHEDNLRRLLGAERFAELSDVQDVLLDLSTIASQSRRFLTMRRALDKTTDEVLAAEMTFLEAVRSLRSTYIRRFLRL